MLATPKVHESKAYTTDTGFLIYHMQTPQHEILLSWNETVHTNCLPPTNQNSNPIFTAGQAQQILQILHGRVSIAELHSPEEINDEGVLANATRIFATRTLSPA